MKESSSSSHSLTHKKKCKKKYSELEERTKDVRKHVSGTYSDDSSLDKKKCLKRRDRGRSKSPTRGHSLDRGRSRSRSHERLPKIKKEPLSDDEAPKKRRSRSPLAPHNQRPRSDRDTSDQRTRHDDNHFHERKRDRERKQKIKEEDEGKHEWGKKDDEDKKKKPVINVAKPDFGLSGKLTEDTNVYNGVVIKYSEPEEARKPKVRWRLYPFKGESSLPVLHLHRQSAYLIGRDRKIADLPVDHPSCSKQHAVFQYRLTTYTRPDGSTGKRVRPYIIDLESANGTFVNNVKIEARKYVELLERDVLKFAFSSREYVLLHENSKDANLDDDVE